MVDVLRATTTMTAILDGGAAGVRPVADLAMAYALRDEDPEALLGGERENQPPAGFDGGNSPFDWPASRVLGRRVIFTTTNGTRAIDQLSGVSQVVLAALTNATAVGRYLWSLNESCLVVASGTRGRIALEDVLAAGAVARVWPEECRSDAAQIATTLFSASTDDLIGWVRRAQHGRDLVALGRDDDLAFAARLDCCAVVPRLGEDGWIRGEISP